MSYDGQDGFHSPGDTEVWFGKIFVFSRSVVISTVYISLVVMKHLFCQTSRQKPIILCALCVNQLHPSFRTSCTLSSLLAPFPRRLCQPFSLCKRPSCPLTLSLWFSSSLPKPCTPHSSHQATINKMASHSFILFFSRPRTNTRSNPYWSCGYMVWIHCIHSQSAAKSSGALLKAAMKHLNVEWICSRLSVSLPCINTHTLLSTASSSLWAF